MDPNALAFIGTAVVSLIVGWVSRHKNIVPGPSTPATPKPVDPNTPTPLPGPVPFPQKPSEVIVDLLRPLLDRLDRLLNFQESLMEQHNEATSKRLEMYEALLAEKSDVKKAA